MNKFVYAGDKFEIDIKGVKHSLKIWNDEDSESPREWDNLTKMYCWHRRYTLGDYHSFTSIREALVDIIGECVPGDDINNVMSVTLDKSLTRDEMNDKVIDALKDYVCIKYLYLYDHSGITISTSDFKDPWDSGLLGIVYLTKEVVLNNISYADEVSWYEVASNIIEEEVDTYDQYLRGDVYGFTFDTIETCPCCNQLVINTVDSMGGFFGNNILTNGMLEYLPDEVTNLFKEEE